MSVLSVKKKEKKKSPLKQFVFFFLFYCTMYSKNMPKQTATKPGFNPARGTRINVVLLFDCLNRLVATQLLTKAG